VVPVALLLMGLRAGEAPRVGRLLDTRPIKALGGFSYSLYLVHAPVVVAVSALLVEPRLGSGLDALGVMLLVALPMSLVWARLFAALFDLPFQRHKSWSALGRAVRARITSAARIAGAQPVAGGREMPEVVPPARVDDVIARASD
jgi:peptidoglycan/LPS O-acetylase OafA/YrhL